MTHFKSYNDFRESGQENVSEGLFDKLFSWISEIGNMFKNPQTIQKSVDTTIANAGNAGLKNLNPKSVAIKETYFVVMGDGKDTKTNFSMSLTKMADLPDGSGLFSISGTSNAEMLKALTGTNVVADLNKNSVMAIVSDKSFTKGMPITIKILKNIVPGGKDYVSKFQVTGIAPGTDVQKVYDKNKTP